MRTWVFLVFLLVIAFFPKPAEAIQANPSPFVVEDAAGNKATLYIRGDERYSWYEDTKGYTVLRDKGNYVYAELGRDGNLVATKLRVGLSDPAASGLRRRTLPWPAVLRQIRSGAFSLPKKEDPNTAPSLAPKIGTVKNLVILIRFANHTTRTLPSNSDIAMLFNAVGGDANLAPTGSVRDIYLENSYGLLTLESSIVGWVDVPGTEQYYANGVSGDDTLWAALRYALDVVDASIDFSEFDEDGDSFIDAIAFIHSGYGAEWGGVDVNGTSYENRIWSHRWVISPAWSSDEGIKVYDYHISPGLWDTSGSDIGRIGVICHETGHFLGLPDLYDTVGSGDGIGSWGMMANSWGFDGSQLHPPHFCGWSKIELGWITPTVISPGAYNIAQVETDPVVLRIDQGYPSDEYLLIENRQPVGIETAMPQGGLCIFHIDDTAGYDTEGYPGQPGWPENGNHYRIALLAADGDYDLERSNNRGDAGDPYHGGGVSRISYDTVPNIDSYQNGTISISHNIISEIGPADANMSFEFSLLNELIVSPVDIFSSSGFEGGPFTPNSKTYTLINFTDSPVEWQAGAAQNWLDVTPSSGTLGSDSSAQVEVALNVDANNLSIGTHSDTVTFTDMNNIQEQTRDVLLEIAYGIYSANMDVSPAGWVGATGPGPFKWKWGQPSGGGGEYGNPDPTSGYTGDNVMGYNLSGDYGNNILFTQWIRTASIDCSNYANVRLQFQRWLNVEQPLYDHAYLEVSNNGSTWNRIWENTVEVADSSWVLQEFDISNLADGQSVVMVRWGMGSTDAIWRYSGWNIDDVSLTGSIAGDFEPDGDIDFKDFTVLAAAWKSNPGDGNWNPKCDISRPKDNVINELDLQVFVGNWLAD